MKYLVCIWIIFICLNVIHSQRRIHGGTVGTQADFKHAVHLKSSKGACTGCIIQKDWVLSAAHCVCDTIHDVLSPYELTITAGTINYLSRDNNTQVRIGKEIHVHEDYKSSLGKPDLSVIKVNESYIFNSFVGKLGFSTNPWPQNNGISWSNCIAAGWGQTEHGQTKTLKYLKTPALHGEGACPCVGKGYILKRYVCLPAVTGGVCYGDSGGALMCDKKIVGVAHVVIDKRSCSYTQQTDKVINCSNPNVYGIYIYTCPYLNWISERVPNIPKEPESCGTKYSFIPIANNYVYIFMFSMFSMYFATKHF